MARPRGLTPLEKVENEIEAIKQSLTRLETERDVLLKYFPNGSRVEKGITFTKSSPETPAKRVDTLEGMTQLVKERKRALSIDEFYEGLKAKGWQSSNKDPKKTIWAAIARGKFKRVKPGYYTVRA